MRRLVLLMAAAGVVTTVLATAASSSPKVAAFSVPSYLPAGETPAGKNWLVGEGDLSSSRFSALSQVNTSNVTSLKVAWNDQFDPNSVDFNTTGLEDHIESQPICCANNMMYVAFSQGVVAVQPDTGAILWKYVGPASPKVVFTTPDVSPSRTIAYDSTLNLVYAGQEDGSIVALNAKTGAPVWTVDVNGTGTYGESAATEPQPFVVFYPLPGTDGVLLSAPNGGESPFRGHMDAYDPKTGALLWRVWSTPDPTQVPFSLTWGNPAEAATGGAATWSVPAVDPALGLVVYGTGNPFPWVGRSPGADLWTDTIMAVDWRTGALKWYFQAVHHDNLDFDVSHPPMILNVPINGKMTAVVAEGTKGGEFFVLNAANGGQVPNFKIATTPSLDPSGIGTSLNNLSPTQQIPQGAADCMSIEDYTAAGLAACGFPANTLAVEYGGTNNINVQANGTLINAANGRAIVGAPFETSWSPANYVVFGGGAGGGTFGYPPSSYDPVTHTYIACIQNLSGGHSNPSSGSFVSSGISSSAAAGIVGFVSSIDLTSNKMAWQYESMATGNGDCYSGDFATAGNLVFTAFKGESDLTSCQLITPACAAAGVTTPGTAGFTTTNGPTPGGNFDAFNATTGQLLWTWGVPYDAFAAPGMTYMYNGKQYIAIYHQLAPAGVPGGTSTGQRDELTVFSL